MVVAFYVDDLIFMGSTSKLVEEFKKLMKKKFQMTYLGLMKSFLGLEVVKGKKFSCLKKGMSRRF